MRRMLLAAVALLAAAGFLAPGAAAARQEPPAAIDVPADEECQGDPQRSVVALFSTPGAATPAADEATATAMTATIRAVVACINAGDYFPVLSLVSDGYLRDRFAPGVPTDPLSEELRPFVEALRGCQTCEVAPIPEQERFGIVAVEQPQSLDGGRAGAVVRLSTAAAPAPSSRPTSPSSRPATASSSTRSSTWPPSRPPRPRRGAEGAEKDGGCGSASALAPFAR